MVENYQAVEADCFEELREEKTRRQRIAILNLLFSILIIPGILAVSQTEA
jgi:hypothetical protein